MRFFKFLAVMVVAGSTTFGAQAQTPQRRVALIIGEGTYAATTLPTAVNDAGLIAQALNDSGFEIVEGRDLDLAGMRQVVQDFLSKVEQSGPDTAAVVYFSGYAAQLEGDNYLLPVDARIMRASDLGMAGFRFSDLIRSLNAATQGAKIVVVDAPRGLPALKGKDIATGLALADAPRGMLIAYATAPGNVLPEGRAVGGQNAKNKAYGGYATVLADQIYQSGTEADELFKRVRLQMHQTTAGIQIPWHSYALAQPFYFSAEEGARQAPPPRPDGVNTPEEAYGIAIETDTISGYQAFLKRYPNHALAKRIKVLLANRREAVVWSRTVTRGSAEAYWSYLKAFPRGPHAEDARRRLAMLSRPISPPASFPIVIYEDVPPPIEIETVYETTYIYNDYRTYYDYPPPPPPPVYLLPPVRRIPWGRPPAFVERPGFLPVPPRPAVLPPPIWRDRPPPPRVAPIMPFRGGRPHPGEVTPVRPGTALPPSLPRPPQAGPDRPERLPPSQPGVMPGRPGAVTPQERARPMERPMPQEGVRPMERPTSPPAQQERPRQMEQRPSSPPAQQERPRQMEQRPSSPPAQQERPRQIEQRPSSPPAQQERPRQMEQRPSSPPPQQERPRQMEQRPSSPPPQQERPRQMEQRPSAPPPQQERPRQMEQRPAPSSPPPAARQPEPKRESPPPSQQRPDRKLRPGEKAE